MSHFGLTRIGGRRPVINAATPVGIGPRINRMVQHPAEGGPRGLPPFQLAPPWPSQQANSQANLIPHQIAVEPSEGAQFIELVEDELYGRSRLFVGVEDDLAGGEFDVP